MTNDDLQNILKRKGYGIQSGLKSSLGKGAVASSLGGSGKIDDVEHATCNAPLRSEAVSFNYAGKCRISIRFYRRRLADYSRAISEKAMLDSLVYASLIRDDSEAEIQLCDLGQVKVESDAEERTEIDLEYLEVDFDNPWIPKTKFGNSGTK